MSGSKSKDWSSPEPISAHVESRCEMDFFCRRLVKGLCKKAFLPPKGAKGASHNPTYEKVSRRERNPEHFSHNTLKQKLYES